jgi:hypothetical protein
VHAPLEVGKWSGEVVHYFVIMFVRKDNTVISIVLFIIDLCKALDVELSIHTGVTIKPKLELVYHTLNEII